MDGGQKVNIPLDSELDIKSSDMLVPVNEPKFQHNRQKFQGRYLPSSVRFEHDGYAAGNDVYEFSASEAQYEDTDNELVIVRKVLDENNPTYIFRIRDADDHIIGTLVFNADSQLKEYTVGSCAIEDDHIRGTFNNKPFDLVYNKDNLQEPPVESSGSSHDSDIVVTDYDMLSKYASKIKLFDMNARIELIFAGLLLPSNVIMNGEYLFGRFLEYLDNTAVWRCGKYTFNVSKQGNTYVISVKDSSGTPLLLNGTPEVVPAVDDNSLAVRFGVNLPVNTYLDVVWQRIYPYFKNVVVASPGNKKTIAYDADETKNYNLWSYSMLNEPAAGSVVPQQNEHMWYRNFKNGHSDFNSKVIKHSFPLWVGVSNVNVRSKYLSDWGVDTYTSWCTTVDLSNSKIHFKTNASNDRHKILRYTDRMDGDDIIDRYGIATGTTAYGTYSLWVGAKRYNPLDKIQDYLDSGTELPMDIDLAAGAPDFGNVIIRPKFARVSDDVEIGLTDGIQIPCVTSEPTSPGNTLYLPFLNNATDIESIRDALTIECASTPNFYVKEIEIHFRMIGMNLRRDLGVFVEDSNTWNVDNYMVFINIQMKKQGMTRLSGNMYKINPVSSFSVSCRYEVVNGNTTTYRDAVIPLPHLRGEITRISDSSTNQAAALAKCTLASKISMCRDSFMYDDLDASYFEIEPADDKYYDVDEVNVSSLFRHAIDGVECSDKLNIGITLCSKDIMQYLYYTKKPLNSEETVDITGHIPPHIKYNTLDETKYPMDNSPWHRVAIRPDYTASHTQTADLNCFLQLIGDPVKYDKDTFYRCIKSAADRVEQLDMLPGNHFTEVLLPEFIEDSTFRTGEPAWWVDVSEVHADDADYIKGTSLDKAQQISMHIGDDGFYMFAYDILQNELLSDVTNAQGGVGHAVYPDSFDYKGSSVFIDSIAKDADSSGFVVRYSVPVEYSFDVKVPVLVDQNMRLVSLVDNIAVVNVTYNSSGVVGRDRYIQLRIDFNMRQVVLHESGDGGVTYSEEHECDENWISSTAVEIKYDGSAYITCCLRGVYSKDNISMGHVSVQGIEVVCEGMNTVLPYNMDVSGISCLYTDIQDAQIDNAKQFAVIKTDAEMQFLKQAWDTTSKIENFWWIDDTHLLELDSHRFVLRSKTDAIDDWNGDVFTDNRHSEIWNRTELIDSSVQQYFCTSAYRAAARLVTVSYAMGVVTLHIYNPLHGDHMLDASDSIHITLGINKKDITVEGSLLNGGLALNTYSDIQPDILITQSKWSATCTDDRIIIGIHYDNNFNQWAAIINLNTGTLEKVIQGYGFVGVHGELTGGEIPTKWFDPEIGFIGAVRDIKYLKTRPAGYIKQTSDIANVDSVVVGTDSQQWYIDSKLSSIVSHLEYLGNGAFRAVELPITSNYSAGYKSASFGSSVLSDVAIKTEAVKDILPINNNAWSVALALWLYPVIWSINPKITTVNYLQQTLGQAAYVHYNSNNSSLNKELVRNEGDDNRVDEYDVTNRQDTKLPEMLAHTNSEELSFDKQKVKQTQCIKDPYTSTFLMCAAALNTVTSFAKDNISFDDKGVMHIDLAKKNLSQYFEENAGASFFTDMATQSMAPTLTSEVIALKSLDMFYSTSEKQQVRAGRGYVNHNFVAQCVSQSVESIQSQVLQQRITFIIKELSMLPLNLEYKVLANIRDGVLTEVGSVSGAPWAVLGLASGGSFPIGALATIGYMAAEVALNYVDIGRKLVADLMEAMGGKLQAAVTMRQSHNDHQVEHKHRYGSKTESFMYPCFGVSAPQNIRDEYVSVSMMLRTWRLDADIAEFPAPVQSVKDFPEHVTDKVSDTIRTSLKGDVPYFAAMVKGVHKDVQLPDRMAYVIGTESFLPDDDYKNRSISESEPVFPTPPFQDYVIDDAWQLAQTASDGMTTWISCRDTKIIDGDYSNVVVTDDFCGVAAPYTAIEVKRGIDKKYIRPWAITPNAIALNNTGMNCVYDEKIYHAFDGYGYRVVNWMGAPGMGKNHQTLMYSFLVNDRFKRGNKMPPNEFIGNFSGEPTVDIHGDSNDKVFTLATQPGEGAGLATGTVGEDKDVRRYAIPVFSEYVNTMPAAVKTVAVQTLSVVDGITSLTTENRDLQTAYKAPVSIDFTIGKNKYRYTQEYICQVTQERGVTLVQDLVPCLGLTYLGSTPYEAYLYSQAERQYYVFTGNSALRKVDMIERFRNVINGRYDFVNQEVILPCVATFLRLDNKVKDDDDETDNTMVARLADNKFLGEVQPPLDTIYNTRSGFRTVSVPSGIAFQGPNRCIINRFVVSDYMIDQIKSNYGKWSRVPREEYHPFRTYKAKYERVDETIGDKVQVEGWTHNPFLLVTAPLGVSENIDCLFEWEITFCYPVEMEKLYGPDNYAVVNVQAETMTPGGKVVAERPVHIYLTKELFTRSDKYGYYSFRYQSRCGAGNRERLHIWSDQYICVSSLDLEYKPVTQRRTEILTQQVDVQHLTEI